MRNSRPRKFRTRSLRKSSADCTAEVELMWPGKSPASVQSTSDLEGVIRITRPRNDKIPTHTMNLFHNLADHHDTDPWLNKLIHGDNKIVLSSLINGALRTEIESVGGVKLIYIDPPFFVGTDYSVSIAVGPDKTPEPKHIVEEVAYKDTWGAGLATYLSMIYERLILMRELLAADGSIWVHCDWKVNFLLRALLNEVFGPESFRNEIIWYYRNKIPDTRKRQYTNSTDTIYYYARSQASTFHWQFDKRQKPIKVSRMKKVDGKKVYLKDENGKGLYDVREYRTADNVWQFALLHAQPEIQGYPTQKPESLLERIILTASNPGDIVADFFCGSGTTLAVAEKLGRKWIGCDNGRVAVQIARKRLVQVQRELIAKGKPFSGFEILRQSPQFDVVPSERVRIDAPSSKHNGPPEEESCHVKEILGAYKAQFISSDALFCGQKGDAAVVVTPSSCRVTTDFLRLIIEEAGKRVVTRVHVLALDYASGLHHVVLEEAPSSGINISLKRISCEIAQGDGREGVIWRFHDAPYVQFELHVSHSRVSVALTNVGILGRPDESELFAIPEPYWKPVITLCGGKIMKISRNNDGTLAHDVLSDRWEDWVDYWAVDFEHGKPEDLTYDAQNKSREECRTGKHIFHEHWQSFRTRKKRSLELTSSEHLYQESGAHTVAVRITDIFGNDAIDFGEVQI